MLVVVLAFVLPTIFLVLLFWDSLICPCILALVYPQSNKSLNQRVVLITGAGRPQGIGYNLALAFLQQGCLVVLWDINAKDLKQAQTTLSLATQHNHPTTTTSTLPRITIQTVDVSDATEVRTAAGVLRAKGLLPSILVNNAGIVRGKSLTQLTPHDLHSTFNVNAIAHFHTLSAFLPQFMSTNDGLVITMSSMMGMMGGAGLADYCASKWSLIGMDESLRMELRRNGSTGVRTLVVCPYMVKTGMFRGAFGDDGDGNGGNGGSGGTGNDTQKKTTLSWVRRAVNGLRDALVPKLSPKQVADAVVVASGQSLNTHNCTCGARGKQLILPTRLSLVPPLLRLLPMGLQEWVLDLGGGSMGMDGFTGHSKRT